MSLTYVIIKVFEGMIRKQIFTSYLSALLSVFDDVMQLLSSGNNTVDMVYLDYAKAFDKLDHGVLLHKIKMLGSQGNWGSDSITF